MPEHVNAIEAQAIDWLVRQRDPAFDEWDGFTDWLEQDAGHAAVYDRLASLDVDLDALPRHEASVEALPQRRPWLANRRTWLGGAVAAALVGVVSFSMLGSGMTRIETEAGEHRTVALTDGSQIEINGESVVEIDEDRPRFARLESGEAMFHVVHRDGDPFTVESGDATLVDLGTAFNVIRREDALSVAVSEGIVLYNPSGEKVRLDAGRTLEARDGGKPVVSDVDTNGIGGWRTGQLVYNGTSVAQVAEDLKRTAGIQVEVSPDVAGLPFRGALLVGKNRQQAIDDLTALAGIRAQKQEKGWLLTR